MTIESETPIACLVASTTVLPELARMRMHVDDVAREHRHHDDRLTRLHLQADDANRRLTRLEGMVEVQVRDTHELARRLDSLDAKVSSLVDGFTHVSNGIDTLMSAFDNHGIAVNEQHRARMRGLMSLWVLLGGSLIVLSALHYRATGESALESAVQLGAKLLGGAWLP